MQVPKRPDFSALRGLTMTLDESDGNMRFQLPPADDSAPAQGSDAAGGAQGSNVEQKLAQAAKERFGEEADKILRVLSESGYDPLTVAKRYADARAWGTKQSQQRADYARMLEEKLPSSAAQPQATRFTPAIQNTSQYESARFDATPPSREDLARLFGEGDTRSLGDAFARLASSSLAPRIEEYVNQAVTSAITQALDPVLPVVQQAEQMMAMQRLATQEQDFVKHVGTMQNILQVARQKEIDLTPEQLYSMACEYDDAHPQQAEEASNAEQLGAVSQQSPHTDASGAPAEPDKRVQLSALQQLAALRNTETGTGDITASDEVVGNALPSSKEAVAGAIQEVLGQQ